MSEPKKDDPSPLDFILPETAWPQLQKQLADITKQLDHCQQQLALAKYQVTNWEKDLAGAKAQKAILQQQLGETAEQKLLLAKSQLLSEKTDAERNT